MNVSIPQQTVVKLFQLIAKVNRHCLHLIQRRILNEIKFYTHNISLFYFMCVCICKVNKY